MSSSTAPQPDPSGSFSTENATQVVVRADKYFLCTACGTLVEIPEEVVGQLVLQVAHREPEAKAETPKAKPKPVVTETQSKEAPTPRPMQRPQPLRPQPPRRKTFAGETIDGLRVPSGPELDRALKWVSFHLRVLDRQKQEVTRLRKLLKDRSQGACQAVTQPPKPEPPDAHQPMPPVHADRSPAGDKHAHNPHERGPP